SYLLRLFPHPSTFNEQFYFISLFIIYHYDFAVLPEFAVEHHVMFQRLVEIVYFPKPLFHLCFEEFAMLVLLALFLFLHPPPVPYLLLVHSTHLLEPG